MSPPVHSESRTLTSFLFLSSSRSLVSARLNFELPSRHPPSIRLPHRRPTVLLLLVIIPILNRATLTEGALEIERNPAAGGVDETRGFNVNPNLGVPGTGDAGTWVSSGSPPYRKSPEARGSEYEPHVVAFPDNGPTGERRGIAGGRNGASPSTVVLADDDPSTFSRREGSGGLEAWSIENSSLHDDPVVGFDGEVDGSGDPTEFPVEVTCKPLPPEDRGIENGLHMVAFPDNGPTGLRGRIVGGRNGASSSTVVLADDDPTTFSRTVGSSRLKARGIENSDNGPRVKSSPLTVLLAGDDPATLPRTKRSITLEARSLFSPRIENASLYNGPVAEFDGEVDGSEGPTKFPVKVTYKPAPAAAQPGAGTPVEKYDRRHFGPPRLENLDEISKGTVEVAGSSSSFDASSPDERPTPDLGSSSSSSTSSFSSSTLLTDLPNSSGDFADGPRDANYNLEPHQQRSPEESLDGMAEKLNRDSERRDNEGSLGRIDPPDESTFVKPSTTPDYSSTRPSSNSIPDSSEDGKPIEEAATAQTYSVFRPGASSYDVDKLELTILGLFELTQGTEARPEGPSELQAARLAVDRINDMNVLPKIKLRLIHNDTRVTRPRNSSRMR